MGSVIASISDHLRRIRYRLLLINVVLVAVPLGGIAFARRHETQLLAALERDMVHQAQLLRAALLAEPDPPRLDGRGAMLAAAARDTGARIRLLDAAGAVRSDSRRAADALEPATRREVRAALAGRYGAATRLDDGRRQVDLFVALPIVAGGEVRGVVYVTRSTAPVGRQLYALRRWLVEVMIAAIVVTAVLTLFLAATIARPLGRLTRVARRIATGDRAEPLALARRDEIGELARTLDAMTRELDRRARAQRDFAADVSHELRAPLTGIRGAAELLRDGAADDPVARARFLAMILDDAARLDRLVARLLELARAESDDSTAVDVDLVALAAGVATRHGARLDAAPPARIRGRPRSLEAALDNLVRNALQHAAPGTDVTVRVRGHAGRVRVEVHNLGAVIPPDLEARIWDRFFTTRPTTGGTGLGLAIVRSVAATHGADAGVTSAPAGTTFWLDLPASRCRT